MEFTDILKKRRSIRSYNGEAVSEDDLKAILWAAQSAPVGMAKYDTLHLTVVTNADQLQAIDEAAQAKFDAPGRSFLYKAPTLIIVSTTGEGNLHYSNAAIVVEHMVLEAVNRGVGACHIWGATMALAEHRELIKNLGIPDGFTPASAVIVGITDEEYTERDDFDGRIVINRA